MLATSTLLASGVSGFDLLMILGVGAAAVVCTAVPLLAGFSRGQPLLGIIAAVVALGVIGVSFTLTKPFGLAAAWLFGLISSAGMTVLMQFIPKLDQSLLSQSEIEAETRRIRGY
jgi:hypothetical protein